LFNRSIGLLESDDETVTLDREQRRRILEQLRKVEQIEKELKGLKEENKKLREENRRLDKELKKLRSTPMMLASSDATAEAGGVPSSKTFYRRPRHSKSSRTARTAVLRSENRVTHIPGQSRTYRQCARSSTTS
jgi:cell division septum initiation protein DivIVA